MPGVVNAPLKLNLKRPGSLVGSTCVTDDRPNRDGRSIENGPAYHGDAKLLRVGSRLGMTSNAVFCAYHA